MNLEEIGERLMKSGLIEVVPGMWVSPNMVGPNNTIILEKRVWEKMQEMAEKLEPVCMGQKRDITAGNARG